MLRQIFLAALVALFASACATARAPAFEEHSSRGERPAKRMTSRRAPTADASIPAGVTCLLRLRAAGVPHRVLGTLANVHTPVRVSGPIEGVHFRPLTRRHLDCDCRFALALARAAPAFHALGVTDVFFSSAYRPHPRGRRRMSRHAMGLALDVHRLRVEGQMLSVKSDFQRGAGCDARGAPLNQLACHLADGLFDRVLTPDTDAAHHDHFHLAILSLERRRHRRKRRPHPIVHD